MGAGGMGGLATNRFGGIAGCRSCNGAGRLCGGCLSRLRGMFGPSQTPHTIHGGGAGGAGATAAYAYPYYTTRGPRDFFINNPPSIGP